MWFCAHSTSKWRLFVYCNHCFGLIFESFSLALPIYYTAQALWALAVFSHSDDMFYYEFAWNAFHHFISLQITKVETIANCAAPESNAVRMRFQLALDLLFNKRLLFFTKLIPTKHPFNQLLQISYSTKIVLLKWSTTNCYIISTTTDQLSNGLCNWSPNDVCDRIIQIMVDFFLEYHHCGRGQ